MAQWLAKLVYMHSLFQQFIDGMALDAMRDFALAEANWYSTWPNNVEDRAMIVYVEFAKDDLS